MHHYIKNGKPFQSETPLFYFGWVYGTGHVEFGLHGTEADYAASRATDDTEGWGERNLIHKRLIPEVSPENGS